MYIANKSFYVYIFFRVIRENSHITDVRKDTFSGVKTLEL